ncbi:MAG: histidine kinase [Rhodothermales bacterium]
MNFIRLVWQDLKDRRRELVRLSLWTFCLATILTLTASGSPYLGNLMAGKPDAAVKFRQDLLWMSIWLYAWLLIVPVIYVLAFRVHDGKRTGGRVFGVYLGGFAYAYIVHVSIELLAMLLPTFEGVHASVFDAVAHHMLSGVFLLSVTYGGVAALCHAIAGHQRSQEVEMRRVRLESELVQARMDALRSQLQPHFLFNALNSVSSLMYRDVEAADDMLAGIGELLRVLIKDSDRNLTTLREELEFVDMYLRIEKIRHGEHIRVERDLDRSLDRAIVPALVLQPIVENAIKHGASQVVGTARITVRVHSEGGTLKLSVSDNGPGFAGGDGEVGSGVGITNLRARLHQLYGTEQGLLIYSTSNGTTVSVEIPLSFHPVDKDQETTGS